MAEGGDGSGMKNFFQRIGQYDQVDYFVFAPPTESNISKFKLEVNAVAQEIIGDYMWHQETFILRLPTKEDVQNFEPQMKNNTTYLYGTTKFGDNVEDEWFIVHVLLEITKRFPGSVARVVDNDGEFLLIEAADYLPDWAESDERCAQRVYLYDGIVHLIPLGSGPLPSGIPPVMEAVKAVRNNPEETKCNSFTRACIQSRIGKYPEKMLENFHFANLMLPPKLAAILKEDPNLLPYGVGTFYFRDPIDIKLARLFKTFKPKEGLVKSRVKFTRCLYAMLHKQAFQPDQKSGWVFPPSSSVDYKAHTLGAKLTLGFEVIASRLVGSLGNPEHTETFHDEGGWLRYEESLKKTGYFKDYLEGSKPYTELVEKAKSFFNDNLTDYVRLEHEDVMLKHFKNLFNTVNVNLEGLKAESETLPAEDDDSWTKVELEDFDALLEKHFKGTQPVLNSQAFRKAFDSKLDVFMNQMSDFKGVEIPTDENTDAKLKSQIKTSKDSTAKSAKSSLNGTLHSDQNELEEMLEPLDFRADEFVSAMDKLLLDLGQKDHDWDASDDSYGSEDDLDVNLEDIKKMGKGSKIAELMGMMDDELALTDVGKTFKSSSSTSTSTQPQPSHSVPASASSTSSSNSNNNPRKKNKTAGSATTTAVEDLEEFDDVEAVESYGDGIGMNMLSDMLESFRSQSGPTGPAANLLRSAGFKMKDLKQ